MRMPFRSAAFFLGVSFGIGCGGAPEISLEEVTRGLDREPVIRSQLEFSVRAQNCEARTLELAQGDTVVWSWQRSASEATPPELQRVEISRLDWTPSPGPVEVQLVARLECETSERVERVLSPRRFIPAQATVWSEVPDAWRYASRVTFDEEGALACLHQGEGALVKLDVEGREVARSTGPVPCSSGRPEVRRWSSGYSVASSTGDETRFFDVNLVGGWTLPSTRFAVNDAGEVVHLSREADGAGRVLVARQDLPTGRSSSVLVTAATGQVLAGPTRLEDGRVAWITQTRTSSAQPWQLEGWFLENDTVSTVSLGEWRPTPTQLGASSSPVSGHILEGGTAWMLFAPPVVSLTPGEPETTPLQLRQLEGPAVLLEEAVPADLQTLVAGDAVWMAGKSGVVRVDAASLSLHRFPNPTRGRTYQVVEAHPTAALIQAYSEEEQAFLPPVLFDGGLSVALEGRFLQSRAAFDADGHLVIAGESSVFRLFPAQTYSGASR